MLRWALSCLSISAVRNPPLPDGPDCVDRVRFGRLLVWPVPEDAGEAERQPARIPGTGLDAVEGDLDHHRRADPQHAPGIGEVPPGTLARRLGDIEEPFCLPAEHLVGQPL